MHHRKRRRLTEADTTGRIRQLLAEYSKACREDAELDFDEEAGKREAEAQIAYMTLYLGHMMTPGQVPSQMMRRIERFMKLQTGRHRRAKLEIRFFSPIHPGGAWVIVRTIKDVDFADTYGLTGFDHVTAKRLDDSRWTKREARQFVKDATWDMDFDGFDMVFDFKIEDDRLCIDCREHSGQASGSSQGA